MFRPLFLAVAAVLCISSQSADVGSSTELCSSVVEIPFEPFSIQVCFATGLTEGDWNSATFKLIPHGKAQAKHMGKADEIKGVLYMWDKWNEELETWQTDGWSISDLLDKRELISKEVYYFSPETLQICIQAAVNDLNSQLHPHLVHIDVGFEPILQNDSELHSIARRRHDFRNSKRTSRSRTRPVERFCPLRVRLNSLASDLAGTKQLANGLGSIIPRPKPIPLSSLPFFGVHVVSSERVEVGNRCSFQLSFILEQPEDSVWKPVLFNWFNSRFHLDPWKKSLYYTDIVRGRQDWTVVLDETKDRMVLKYLGVLSRKKPLRSSILECVDDFNQGRNANDVIIVGLRKRPGSSDYRLEFRYGGWASPAFNALTQEEVLLSRRRLRNLREDK